MKSNSTHIVKICIALGQSNSLEEFTICINSAKDDLYKAYSLKNIRKRSIAFYSDNRIEKQKYKTFNIKKKSGKDRIIHSPYKGLKTIQRCINHMLVNTFEHHSFTFGFVPNRSIVDGAKLHTGRKFVFNIDLKDFFPTINSRRIAAVLQLPPFEFKTRNAIKVANICTTNLEVEKIDKNGKEYNVIEQVLPQGAPTSPVLTNIICQRLDRKLSGLAKKFGLTYSRYADDITFSSDHYVYSNSGKFKKELSRIVLTEGFRLNENKTRLLTQKGRQEVTGVTVNNKVNISRKYLKQLRTILHNWEKSGYEKANNVFITNYGIANTKSGHFPKMENVIEGKLRYMAMVKGPNDATFKALLARFKKLTFIQALSSAIGATGSNQLKDDKKIIRFEDTQKSNDSDFQRIQSVLNQLKNADLDKVLKSYGRS